MRYGSKLLLVLCLLVVPCASATTFLVTASGSFSAATPSNAYTAPNGLWTLSFDVQDGPQTTFVDSNSFDPSFSNFSYSLNGSSVAVAPANIVFFNEVDGGLFTVCLDICGLAGTIFEFEGAQAYSGLESDPTILTGSYPLELGWVTEGSATRYFFPAAAPVVISSVTPEPSTIALLGTGLLSFGTILRRRTIRARAAEIGELGS